MPTFGEMIGEILNKLTHIDSKLEKLKRTTEISDDPRIGNYNRSFSQPSISKAESTISYSTSAIDNLSDEEELSKKENHTDQEKSKLVQEIMSANAPNIVENPEERKKIKENIAQKTNNLRNQILQAREKFETVESEQSEQSEQSQDTSNAENEA